MQIHYQVNPNITTDDFIYILERSSLAERRPINDRTCMEGMLQHADLTICAFEGEKIIGIARSITDFHYCCYLSDLAIDETYQHQGIGKALVEQTKQQLAQNCKLILLSAPKATTYYPKIGFTQHPSAWYL
ncbi:MAG: GNAT family N-acetyltransferase [Epsilonproteobacteria bacterium]|nr:GNAT family N-acetyltransferase [Campylobacterota bacterium]